MVPQPTQLFSPSELAYLQSSLCLNPPIRPDGRSPTTFRPLRAETDFLPSANGSARICFADGTEAIVGVKAEVSKSKSNVTEKSLAHQFLGGGGAGGENQDALIAPVDDKKDAERGMYETATGGSSASWVEVTIEIPGQRDDDNIVVFLSQMIHEGLVADRYLENRLRINTSWHWKFYIDILLLSAPLSYPLPLISLATHLALLNTALPALLSSGDEDPLFNDDWAAAIPLYNDTPTTTQPEQRAEAIRAPPITLLLTHHSPSSILFDPSAAELAVADAVVAITIANSGPSLSRTISKPTTSSAQVIQADTLANEEETVLKILSLRTLDPPSRLYAADVPSDSDALDTETDPTRESGGATHGRWRPARGGVNRTVLKRMAELCVGKGGAGEEVLGGLKAWAGM